MTYRVRLSRQARRALTDELPQTAAAACVELLSGDLQENPQRIGGKLAAPFKGHYSARRGEYRIRYLIDERAQVVNILAIRHRRDAYRS